MTALLTQEQKSTAFLLIRPYNAVSSVCVCVCVFCQPWSFVSRSGKPEGLLSVISHPTGRRVPPVGCVYTLYFPGSKLVGGTSHTARLGPSKA
jgi:hypothetical protein